MLLCILLLNILISRGFCRSVCLRKPLFVCQCKSVSRIWNAVGAWVDFCLYCVSSFLDNFV